MTSSRITSRQNSRVKEAVKLRTGRGRQRQGRFVIDGSREIRRAIESAVRCTEAFVCDELTASIEGREAVEALRNSGAEILSVTRDVYAKLAFGNRGEGIVVVGEIPRLRLQDLYLPTEPIVAVLEGVEKPGNLGAILRSADAAGVDAVIVADGRTDLYNPSAIRASLGTVFRPNTCEATSADTLNWIQRCGLRVVTARPDAKTCYTDVDLRGSVAIVLGSEAAGLSEAWSGTNGVAIRLPMHGMADSLNVSTTAAVLFYESLRQRA